MIPKPGDRCCVCDEPATHLCGQEVHSHILPISMLCGAPVCDGCDGPRPFYRHVCTSKPARRELWAEYDRQEKNREAENVILAEVARERRERLWEASKDPTGWTIGFLRQTRAELWARCPHCKTELLLMGGKLAGRDGQHPGGLKVRCHECGALGQIVVRWGSKNHRKFHNLMTGEHEGEWPKSWIPEDRFDGLNEGQRALADLIMKGDPETLDRWAAYADEQGVTWTGDNFRASAKIMRENLAAGNGPYTPDTLERYRAIRGGA